MSQSRMIDRLEPRRLLANMIVDPTFGTGGFTAGGFEEAFVGTSGDGVLTRLTVNRNDSTSYSYRRYLSSGVLDPAFHPIKQIGYFDWKVATDSAGRLLVGESADNGGVTVTRYSLTGGPDATFGKNGISTVLPTGLPDFMPSSDVLSEAAGPDRSIYVLVATGGVGVPKTTYAVSKLNPDGAVDRKFGNNGTAEVGQYSSSFYDEGRILIDALGRPHVIIPAQHDYANPKVIRRLTATGQLDTSFTTIAIPSETVQRAITTDASGRVLMTIRSTVAGQNRGQLMRFDNRGRLDQTFGARGVATPYDASNSNVSDQYIIPLADGSVEAQFGQVLVRLDEHGQNIPRQSFDLPQDIIVRAVTRDGGVIAEQQKLSPDTAVTRLVATPFAAVLKNGTLTLTGTNRDDVFSLRPSGPAGRVLVGYNGARLGLFNGVKAITAALGDGNDVLQARTLTQPMAVTGGLGNDTIATGLGIDSIDLGNGSNAVDAGSGGGVITATFEGVASEQPPMNVIDARGQARDRWKIDIPYGRSRVSASGLSATVALGSSKSVAVLNFKQGVTVYGTAGNDTIYTGRGNDSILGGRGDDIIDAGTGRDTLDGGDGFDRYRVIGDDDSFTGFEAALS